MKRKVILDIVLNVIASILPMFTLQFVILPRVALKVSDDSYGLILTIMAFIYLTSTSFGSVLNNSKLIHYKKYEELEIQGDYSIFLIIFIVVNILTMSFGLRVYGKSLDMLTNITLTIISTILLINTYAIAEFRIKLNFRNILVNSVILLIGYLLGFSLFIATGYWYLIYLVGFGLSFTHILRNTNVIYEKITKTILYDKTARELILLLGSGLLTSLGAYADKLIIFPLLGGSAVAIYYTSTILGKTVALAIGPITGVLLSYLARMKQFSTYNFKLLLAISVLLGILGYFGIVLVSKPLLTIVYPQYVAHTIRYIPITTLSIMISIVCSVINPVLLKFSSAKWQLFINGQHIVFYVFLSIGLLSSYGLYGLCIGILISNIIKLFVMIFVYFYTNKSYTSRKTSEVL